MATNQFADNKHDVLSLAGRVINFYRFFNRQDWSRCYEYIDPRLRARGSAGLEEYSRAMHSFFGAYGPIRDVKIVKLTIYPGGQAKDDERDFAYTAISWKDKKSKFHHFRERWIKDGEKWFTRVVGLIPGPSES